MSRKKRKQAARKAIMEKVNKMLAEKAEKEKEQRDLDKTTNEVLKKALQPDAPPQLSQAATPPTEGEQKADMTKYAVIGGVVLLVIVVGGFLIFRKPSAAPAPAK